MVEKEKLGWCYYFKSEPRWIRMIPKGQELTEQPGISVSTKQTMVKKHYKSIADSGLEFYTCDDDDLDKEYGMYWGELDFDPLDIMESRSGHVKMFYKENGKWCQL